MRLGGEAILKHSLSRGFFMKRMSIGFALALLLGAAARNAGAQTATQSVAFEVSAVNSFAVSGDPAALVLSSATAGSGLNPASDATTSYSLTTNANTWKITAALDADMPSDLQLDVLLAAPGASATSGTTTLSLTDADVVTGGTGALSSSANQITYTLSAPSGVAAVQTGSRTVTFTLVPIS
jgi:hypothetical protein